MIVVMLVIMLSIVHTMQGQPCRPQKVKVSSTLPALALLEKKKGNLAVPSSPRQLIDRLVVARDESIRNADRTGGFMTD